MKLLADCTLQQCGDGLNLKEAPARGMYDLHEKEGGDLCFFLFLKENEQPAPSYINIYICRRERRARSSEGAVVGGVGGAPHSPHSFEPGLNIQPLHSKINHNTNPPLFSLNPETASAPNFTFLEKS